MKGIGYFFKALRVMGVVSEWSAKALEDEKVTMAELVQLGEAICTVLGVKTEFDVSLEEPK